VVDGTFECACAWLSVRVRMWSECDSVENGDSSRGGCGWNSLFCSCWGICDPVPGLCHMIQHLGWAIANLLTHLAGLLHHEFPFVLSYIVPSPNVHLEPYSGRK